MRSLLVFLLVLAGCDSAVAGVDVSGLSPMPDPAQPLTNVHPTQSASYWELRFIISEDNETYAITSSGSRASFDSTTMRTIDDYRPNPGIHEFSCIIGQHCFSYLAAVKNQVVSFYDSPEEFLAFLGDLDTIDEVALYLATQQRGAWNTDTRETGYRTVADGWEVVLLETVSNCNPHQIDQVVLHVSRAGVISEVERARWQRDDVCYVV